MCEASLVERCCRAGRRNTGDGQCRPAGSHVGGRRFCHMGSRQLRLVALVRTCCDQVPCQSSDDTALLWIAPVGVGCSQRCRSAWDACKCIVSLRWCSAWGRDIAVRVQVSLAAASSAGPPLGVHSSTDVFCRTAAQLEHEAQTCRRISNAAALAGRNVPADAQ